MGRRLATVRLTCKNHTKLLVEGLWSKYERKESTDLWLEVGETLELHSLLLSIMAPKLLEKFRNSKLSFDTDCSLSSVVSILEFLYKGYVDVCEGNLEDVAKTAAFLGAELVTEAVDQNRRADKKAEPRQMVTRNCSKKLVVSSKVVKRKRKRTSSSSEDEDQSVSESPSSGSDCAKEGSESEGKKAGLTIKCCLCDYESKNQRVYAKHLASKHRLDAKKNRVQLLFKCSECQFTSGSKERLNEHKRCQHESKRFQCCECEFFTDKKKVLDRHVNCYHSVDRPFKCPNCDYTARTLKLLTSHRKIHSGQTFVCKVCDRNFTTKCYLDRHTKLHTNSEKKFSCQFCTHRSRSRHDMDKHLKTLHSFVRPKPLGTKPKSEIPVGGYRCTHCEYKTRYRTCWVDHLASKHKVDPEGNTVVPSIRCKLCDFTCLVQYQLYTHMAKVHLEKRFKCQQCPYSSFRKADITLHTQSKHGNERPYMCETCGFRSKTQCDIRRHTLTHTIGKRFVCEFCNKAYAFKYYLTKHMLRVHPKNDKQLRCCLCSYTTKTPPYLIGHTKRMHKEVVDPENAIQRAIVMEGVMESNNVDVYEPLQNMGQPLPSCQQQLPTFH